MPIIRLAITTFFIVSVAAGADHPAPPVEPEASLDGFRLSGEATISLVAAEPEVVDPIAIAFDDQGDLWVVEMRDYPNGPAAEGDPPLSQIRVLRDEDLDGRYDTAITFAESLPFATGLQLWGDGAVVTTGSKVLFLRDTNRDGVADHEEVWFDGLAEENPQLRANHPSLGLDHWLYIANGLRSTAVIDRTADQDEMQPLNLSGRDFRIDMRRKLPTAARPLSATPPHDEHPRMEAVTGPSQFGLTWDRFGRRYFCSNRNPCVEVAVEQRDAARSPLVGIAPLTRDVIPAGEASQVHPLVDAWTTSNLHAGQFTAACGVLVTATDHLPKTPLGHALVCEPTGHLVHRRSLGRRDGRTEAVDEAPRSEWLASYDTWFRPVNLSEGPDGAIYVVDMYRAVIEHPDWVPDELKNRPDARHGDDRGRIYRVGAARGAAVPEIFHSLRQEPLRDRDSGELVALLADANEWVRATAARLLLERQSVDSIDALTAMATSGRASEARLRAAYLLLAWNALEDEVVQSFLYDHDMQLRAAGWRILAARQTEDDAYRDQAASAVGSVNLDVAISACWYLANSEMADTTADSAPPQKLLRSAVRLAVRNADDPYALMAVTAASRHWLGSWYEKWIGEIVDSPFPGSPTVGDTTWAAVERLAKRYAAADTDEGKRIRSELLSYAAGSPSTAVAEPQRLWLSVALGWAEGAGAAALHDEDALWDWSVRIATDAGAPHDSRTAALRLLRFAPSNLVATQFPAIIEETDDGSLAIAAIAAWAQHDDDRVAGWLLEHFGTAPPRQRAAMFDALTARPERLTAMVEAMEAGRMNVRSLDASQIQRLASAREPALTNRIAKLLEGAVDPDRSAVLDQYADCLNLEADARAGAAVFVQHCASCHKIGEAGHEVGPDISDSRTQTPAQLLTAIVDPNRAIDSRYFRYVVLTGDGRVIDGVVTEETSETVTLVRQNAERVVVQRDEILELKPAGVSLMPEGIEAQITPQEMADLIAYIKNWRYLSE